MAFKISQSLATQYEKIKGFARHLRVQSIAYRDRMAAGDVSISEVLALLTLLRESEQRFSTVPPGLAEYAKAQENDAGYDVVVEFSAMLSAVNAASVWVKNNIPVDGQNRILAQTMNADGSVSAIMVTSNQTASLRILLNAIVNSVA